MRVAIENDFVHFVLGFAFGIFMLLVVMLMVDNYSASDYEYKYIDIGDLTCLEISSEIVSCDWAGFKE